MLQEQDFKMLIEAIEEQCQGKVFTIKVVDHDNPFEEDEDAIFCIIVFEDKRVLDGKITTFSHEGKLAIRTQGKWL